VKTLRKGEMCPLHKSFYCCGRSKPRERDTRKRTYLGAGIRRIEDEHHPKGYRELCSPSELRRRKHALMSRGGWFCLYCYKDLRTLEYGQIELCHIEPKGMGGARRDDSVSNLALACKICNRENGSRRVA
jgi:hypothetical protein